MGAIINGLSGTEADTGIDPEAILPLIACAPSKTCDSLQLVSSFWT